MPTKPTPRQDRDWYSIPLSSVRNAVILLIVVLMLIGGSVLFQRWQHQTLGQRAQLAIDNATLEIRKLEGRDDFDKIRIEHSDAWEDLASARAEYSAERFAEALGRAEGSLRELHRLSQISPQESAAKIRFESLHGGVEYRRGERGAWKRARQHDSLNPGDWVKTSSSGSAEIRFPDGSRHVLLENTMVHLDRKRSASGTNEQVTDIVFGWVEFNTTRNSGRVITPASEALVKSSTEAMVSYDRNQGTGQFAAYSGGVDVTSKNGQTRQVRALQSVTQEGDLLSEPTSLPAKPRLVQPSEAQQIPFTVGTEMYLRWQPAARASRYALRISKGPLFATTVISDEDRIKTSARLSVHGPGEFYWQVAAISADGSRGPWSETHTFRLVRQEQARSQDDKIPPVLEIEDIQTYGRVVLVTGRTEPDAAVQINGEPVAVALSGSFSKTIQMKQEGFAYVEVTAIDPWENSTDLSRRVFIDAF